MKSIGVIAFIAFIALREVNAALTDGFTEQTVELRYAYPYNKLLSERYSYDGGTDTHTFTLAYDDAKEDSGTSSEVNRRCELRFISPTWTSGSYML